MNRFVDKRLTIGAVGGWSSEKLRFAAGFADGHVILTLHPGPIMYVEGRSCAFSISVCQSNGGALLVHNET